MISLIIHYVIVPRKVNLNNKTSSFHELEITKWNLEKALEVRKILTFYAYFIVLTQSFQRWEFYSERVFEHVYAKKQEELRGGLLNWQLCLFCSPLNQHIAHIDHKSNKSKLKNSNSFSNSPFYYKSAKSKQPTLEILWTFSVYIW